MAAQDTLTLRSSDFFLGRSSRARLLGCQIERLSRFDVTTLIQGPSGTGKECVAKRIHQLSKRAQGPWVAVNCSAIPADLFESELFGHTAHAFTGAGGEKLGLIPSANQGTLFLDEVGELPLPLQAKLLRVLQERLIRPLGATHEKPVNIRVIAASHQSLLNQVEAGQFRLDLYHRLNTVHLEMPSLLDQMDDLEHWVNFLMTRASTELQVALKSLSPDALAALKVHPFSGHIRELDNRLRRALVMATGPKLTVEDLDLRNSITPRNQSTASADPKCPESLRSRLEMTEQAALGEALSRYPFDRHKAAQYLGITERSLRYRLQKLRSHAAHGN